MRRSYVDPRRRECRSVGPQTPALVFLEWFSPRRLSYITLWYFRVFTRARRGMHGSRLEADANRVESEGIHAREEPGTLTQLLVIF